MELETPTWLDEMFLSNILQDDLQMPVKVLRFSVKPAVPAGANFCSRIYRVSVDYSTECSGGQSISLIVKAPVIKGYIKDFAEKTNFYEKEPQVYGKLLMKMSEKVKVQFGPKYYPCSIKGVLVLKDLNPEGYVSCDQFQQLDYPHCRYFMVTLAKFHAASVACHKEDPELIETLGKEHAYTEDGPAGEQVKSIAESTIKSLLAVTKEMDGQEKIVNLLSNISDTYWQSLVNICKPRRESLNVLNHGDSWMNNLLFKYSDSGEIMDLKFIDFQIMRFGSPVLDLVYFTWSSANEKVREDKLQDLYDTYLETLNKTLEDLGCEERMTPEQLREDLETSSEWAISIVCFLLPLTFCDTVRAIDSENVAVEDFQGDEEFMARFKSPHYRTLLPSYLRQILRLYNF